MGASMRTPQDIAVSGVGLFSAQPSRIVLRPAHTQSGIRFFHPHIPSGVPAQISNLRIASGPLGGRNTVIGDGSMSIATVEHLISALAGLGIWNTDIVIDSEELPILDGSALGFVEALRGSTPSSAAALTLPRAVRVEDAATGAWIEARPARAISYRYELRYPSGSGLADQDFEWNGDRAKYAAEIAPARTFSLEREARAMKAAGLFPHLTPRDMLVIAPDGRAIDNTLRFPDEPARHKLLDLIGDLALLGGPLVAEVVAHKSSHALTHELCRRIASERCADRPGRTLGA